ncbi:latrophilin Cirl isoform X5 [Nilaparvata lugens]|uniref:latrophilin Cirl isoform X5 n=1 Tax=Nilaparvata lugens TaxID=108931 RepID=UPI00193DA50B|nr:latrophilin Cirl isoform X5 [Nilaparvata lugens]
MHPCIAGVFLLTVLLEWEKFCVQGIRMQASDLEQPLYDTAYACEGKTLKIECKAGELIHLIRANYGRFSITICNDHGNTDWSVNCMSPKSLRVLHSKCTQNQNCSIPASTSLFSDPCPGTLKYLEAHYQCLSATLTTSTSKPSPPVLMTSQPTFWSTAKAASLRPAPPAPTQLPPPAPPAPPASAPVDQLPPETSTPPLTTTHLPPPPPPTSTTQAATQSSRSPSMDISGFGLNWPENTFVGGAEYCGQTSARGLYWNWTRVGDVSVQPCPGGATGVARWRCVGGDDVGELHPVRVPSSPDLSECRSVWLANLESRITTNDGSITSIASDLAKVTDSKTLYGGDMMTTTKIIRNMSEKMSKDIQTYPDPRQREAIVTELLYNVVCTASHLLDASQLPSWRDLTHKEQMEVATYLLVGIEDNSFLLADTVIREKTVIHAAKNILLSVRVVEIKNVGTEVFPSEDSNEQWLKSDGMGTSDWLRLEKDSLAENGEGGLVRLVFVVFDRLEEILQPQPWNATRVINSKVISASLGKGRHIQLSEPVTVCLRHLYTDNLTNPTCVFWDYTTSAWSEDGCKIAETNKTHTICKCEHLTNFAILMDVHATYLPPTHQLTLQVITYIGCIISVICLTLAIITFQLFRGLKSDRTTIHKNLCICLLIAEVLFLAGIGQTEEALLCGVIAGLLHFFFLCAFAWMFLEGFQLYVMLIEVFEAEKSRIRWYYLFAYGLPLVIVAVSCFIDPFSYGTDRYCWLRADNFFIFSFVGPVIVVIIANLVFLSLAIFMMCRHANASVSMKSKEHSRLASARAWLRGAIVLVFLLGLTWTFGLLYLNKESVVMAYIFTVLNSLQGLFIFVFHCVQNEKVQKEYRKMARRHRWLGCADGGAASGSGGTSGGGTSGTSGSAANPAAAAGTTATTGVKDRRPSLYASSNGNPLTMTSYLVQSRRAGGWSLPQSGGVSTLPTRHTHSHTHTHSPSSPTHPHAPNIPKSVTTWGPLHKPFIWKNISFKSYSRDSGHGGSEQEESPRACTMTGTATGSRQRMTPLPATPSQHYRTGKHRAASPWNHTYTEIREQGKDDPVYEEIERERERERERELRNGNEVSDMSDEDGRRQSDMSRQSSRSYGDHRPLIAYSPPHGHPHPHLPHPSSDHRNLQAALDAALRHQARTVAVLDRETVVCHLQSPPDRRNLYNCRSPYSEC